jgi:tRNA G37 N-methylase Trm5
MAGLGRYTEGSTIVDLYAGIGYYTLPLLVHGRAGHVHACELNPDAVTSLRANLKANGVTPDRYTIHPGDNRSAATAAGTGAVADRVLLGLLPSSTNGWPVAVDALKPEGGWMHLHENVADADALDAVAVGGICSAIQALMASRRAADLATPSHRWHVRLAHAERVKRYVFVFPPAQPPSASE